MLASQSDFDTMAPPRWDGTGAYWPAPESGQRHRDSDMQELPVTLRDMTKHRECIDGRPSYEVSLAQTWRKSRLRAKQLRLQSYLAAVVDDSVIFAQPLGLHIRDIAPDLKATHRPLGYTSINSTNKLGLLRTGFG
jgi:hypothetical protein